METIEWRPWKRLNLAEARIVFIPRQVHEASMTAEVRRKSGHMSRDTYRIERTL